MVRYGLALATWALASAAHAQGWSTIRGDPSGPGQQRQVDTAERDIRAGRRSGQLARQQARDLRREGGMIASLRERYATGGLSDSELAELRVRSAVQHDMVANARLRTAPKPDSPR